MYIYAKTEYMIIYYMDVYEMTLKNKHIWCKAAAVS